MLADFLIGLVCFIFGAGSMAVVGALGTRHLMKHPEIIMKFLARKVTSDIRKHSSVDS